MPEYANKLSVEPFAIGMKNRLLVLWMYETASFFIAKEGGKAWAHLEYIRLRITR
jgi:hypothetical protein